jgi:dTDP-L-rhamnose 4-epimerase
MECLITGGAGFIGQHLTKALLSAGHTVRILDNFSPQIHGENKVLPICLSKNVKSFVGDIRDKELLTSAINGVDAIIHLAAETGTGQSMYEIEQYYSVNVQGTALLLDILQNNLVSKTVKTIIVASSRAVYGEGAYICQEHGVVYPEQRLQSQLENGIFDPSCPVCNEKVLIASTGEISPFKPMSFYGITKQVQEQSVLLFAKYNNINAFALRYQNVYGPGQSLNNPYTGILAVFSTLAKVGKTIEVYEDGNESRDFVYVDDVIDATMKAIQYKGNFVGPLNVGSGTPVDVITVANMINRYFGAKSEVKVTGAFRMGDIRHNKAELNNSKKILNYTPKVVFEVGLNHFLNWAEKNESNNKKSYEDSVRELQSHGLMGKSKL